MNLAVAVVKFRTTLLTVWTRLALENVIVFVAVLREQTALETLAPLQLKSQAETETSEKAEGKVRLILKLAWNGVVALRRMEYCEANDFAVLGVAADESTAKLMLTA